ncbi:glycosyltransferase family 61 protein [Acetobacter estunensis]|uniref:glycosyltransferase family 61 protein n=1 Tax=Acetobacter estunensis TaxID=104097 RepID=UPI0030D20A6F
MRRLLLPEPTFQINHFCMKEFIAFTNTIGDRVTPSTDERPVFLTKKNLSQGVLNCVNEDEFCARLESRGFRIESPEHHTLRQQIAFFHNPAGVAGMLGSNMHTSIFSRKAYGLVLHVVPYNSNSFYLLDACNQADFRYVTSPSITETEAAPGFRHSFRMENPVQLADAFADAFFAQQTEILSKRRANRAPKQSTPMAFYAVRNETGEFLTARHADGKLVVSSEASPLLYPIIAALGQDGKVELFAEAPAPFPVTASTTSHWTTSISGRLTIEDIEGVSQPGIQHNGKWLTLPPHSDGTEASFRAEIQLGWECVTFVELSLERNQAAQRLYDQIHGHRQQAARVSGGFLMA